VGIARGHHWISQTYLARFTVDGRKDSQLHVVDLALRKDFPTTPANICKERDFNRIESSELPPDALETALSKFEELLAPALTEVLQAPELTSWNNWNTILNFVALLAARNPVMRQHATKRATDQWIRRIEEATDTPAKYAAVIAKAQAAGDLPPDVNADFDKHQAFLASRNFTVDFPHGYYVPAEFDAMDEILRMLGTRHWLILRAAEDSPGFVTTDRAVTLCRRDGRHPSPEYPVGYDSPDTLVTFPLSPRLFALGSFRETGKRLRISDANRHIVARANFTIIRTCHRQVFSPDGSFEVRPAPESPVVVGKAILDLFGEWEGGDVTA
jgi:hypothetical protein